MDQVERPWTPIRRAQAVVNANAGGVGPRTADELRELLESFGVQAQVTAAASDSVEQALRSAVAAAPDLLIVLAGDGTARRAAALCGPDGPLLAPLPGGTMNMLPRALYGAKTWPEALGDCLTNGRARPVSCGEAGGKRFYCAAILGYPALWQPAREAARRSDLRAAWEAATFAMRRAFSTRVRFQAEGYPKHRFAVLGLICPLVSRAAERDDCLEAAGLTLDGPAKVFRLALSNMLGDWRDDVAVTMEPCVRGRAWARRRIPCLLDGELDWLDRTSDIRFHRQAFRALAPPPEPSP